MSFLRVADRASLSQVAEQYRKKCVFFPLIMAVLEQRQQGVVYVNKLPVPDAFYVEHKFGFSQLCGTPNQDFQKALVEYLFISKSFSPLKIRCYAPESADFFLQCDKPCLRSQRTQLRPTSILPDPSCVGCECVELDAHNVDEANEAMGVELFRRFWQSRNDFLTNGFGVLVKHGGQPASICYSAAIADGIAEIDVATTAEARMQGFGKAAVIGFMKKCRERGVIPNWDCFTNNTGSMRLAASVGFVRHQGPYDFFTIAKSEGG